MAVSSGGYRCPPARWSSTAESWPTGACCSACASCDEGRIDLMTPEERRSLRTESTVPPAPAAEAAKNDAAQPMPELPQDALIIIPVRNMVLFPGVVRPVAVGRERSIAAAQEAARGGHPLGVLLQRDAEAVDPAPADLHDIGTVASVLRYLTAQDGTHHVICQGTQRFRVLEFLDGYPFLVARVERLEEAEVKTTEIERSDEHTSKLHTLIRHQ